MLAELRDLGVSLWIDTDGRLAFDGPAGVIDDDLLGRMKTNREDLLAQLRESSQTRQEPATESDAATEGMPDGEPFDEIPLASVPECFECGRLCDRLNGLGLWYCGKCDPMAEIRERKTRDVLRVKRRWEMDEREGSR